MLENLINGNLKDAKRQAKRHSLRAIGAYLLLEAGWTPRKAARAAAYLKGLGSFQAYCDAE